MNRLGVIEKLLQYFWHEKLWFLVPFVVTLVIIGILLVFAQSSPVLPFLYTAF